jgi:hypothetical protein
MGEELVKIGAAAVATLLVSWILVLLKQGGRRRRLREEIKGELELLEKLGDRPGVAGRLSARVDWLLDRYEPAKLERKDEQKRADHREPLVVSGVITGGMLLALFLTDLPIELVLVSAVGLAILIGVILGLRDRWRDLDPMMQFGVSEEGDAVRPVMDKADRPRGRE